MKLILFLILRFRWKAGIASSLNYVDLNTADKTPKLIPYPSWENNRVPQEKCENGCRLRDNATIISTFRIQADNCDRLWVLDTGLADILGEGKQVTGNAIVIFDLNTDKLIKRFTIPKDQVKQDSFFANIVSSMALIFTSNQFQLKSFRFFPYFPFRLWILNVLNARMPTLMYQIWGPMVLLFIL